MSLKTNPTKRGRFGVIKNPGKASQEQVLPSRLALNRITGPLDGRDQNQYAKSPPMQHLPEAGAQSINDYAKATPLNNVQAQAVGRPVSMLPSPGNPYGN